MPSQIHTPLLILILHCLGHSSIHAQAQHTNNDEPATIILFRTFDIFSFDRSYKLYASDSLLGRIRTKDVIIVNTYDKGTSLHATTKAPSLNATKQSNYQKKKTIRYPITLKSGRVYFVKCGYKSQNLFDLPRQPTIKLLSASEAKKYLRKQFLRKKIEAYLFEEWLIKKEIRTQ